MGRAHPVLHMAGMAAVRWAGAAAGAAALLLVLGLAVARVCGAMQSSSSPPPPSPPAAGERELLWWDAADPDKGAADGPAAPRRRSFSWAAVRLALERFYVGLCGLIQSAAGSGEPAQGPSKSCSKVAWGCREVVANGLGRLRGFRGKEDMARTRTRAGACVSAGARVWRLVRAREERPGWAR